MKIRELREKSKEDLRSLLQEKREEAARLRFLVRQKKMKNVREIANVKKDVARILTLLKLAEK